MKVAFDASTCAFKNKTGTGVYSEEVIKAYQERFQEDDITHAYRLSRWLRGRDYLLPLGERAQRRILIDPVSAPLGLGFDVFHGLNTRLPVLWNALKVATVHDLFSIFGKFSDEKFLIDQSAKLSKMIRRADQIIVPASFTKRDLISKMGVPSDKISVVGEGVRKIYLGPIDKPKSQQSVQAKWAINGPFLLFVGTLEKRKNLVGLIRAFEELKKVRPQPLQLVLVGHPGFGFNEIEDALQKSAVKNDNSPDGFCGSSRTSRSLPGLLRFVTLSWEEGLEFQSSKPWPLARQL